MNPLKSLFSKVFDSAPPQEPLDESKQETAFEWNPDQETVAPTSAQSASWKRQDVSEEDSAQVAGDATHVEAAGAAHSLPAPLFGKTPPPAPAAQPAPEPAPLPSPSPWKTPTPTPTPTLAAPNRDVAPSPPAREWVKASVPDQPAAVAPLSAQSMIPVSDFEDVYRKAGIKSPVHGYGVERVYRLLTSRRLVGLDRSVRRSALLTALDAAGVPASDVSQDAVLRRKALTAYEAEKALELQSLRSRNESRAEALQDTVETFTRQKQSQIERLAQGSTSAVRSQSDLEIRKRMEQDRLYRSLAYFVEPLPSPTAPPKAMESRPAPPPSSFPPPPPVEPRPSERFDATIEMAPPAKETEAEASQATPSTQATPPPYNEVPEPQAAVAEAEAATPPGGSEASVSEEPAPEGVGADTTPVSQSGLETALKAAAEEARREGWGKAAIVEHPGDPVEALRKLRESPKTESES